MRTIAVVVAVIASLTMPGLPSGNAASTRPVVVLVGRTPLVVAGSRFVAGERVVVTLVRATPTRKRVLVDRNGRFFVRFPGVRVAPCSSMVVTVLSQRGTTRISGGRPDCRAD